MARVRRSRQRLRPGGRGRRGIPDRTGLTLPWQGVDAGEWRSRGPAARCQRADDTIGHRRPLRPPPAERRRTRYWPPASRRPCFTAAAFTARWRGRRRRPARAGNPPQRPCRRRRGGGDRSAPGRTANPSGREFSGRLDALAAGGCLSGEVARGAAPGYALTYLPGVRDDSGAIAIFAVCAQPQSWFVSGAQVLVADESGARAALVADDAHGAAARLPRCDAGAGCCAARQVLRTALRPGHLQAGYPRHSGRHGGRRRPAPAAAGSRSHLARCGNSEVTLTYLTGDADAAFKILLRGELESCVPVTRLTLAIRNRNSV
ncbi:MAG: hypothetical protein MZW92_21820, partial [Comamonadaceae bacterium]|nr:hypothetical protein [Comamonadaceae bacterium]